MARTRHLLETDPAAAGWPRTGGTVGVATSFNREKLWGLATYAVRPGLQGRGIGRALLAAALHHGVWGSLRGMLSSSRTSRRYAATDGRLLAAPQMFPTGTVDRSAIPVVEKVREIPPATSSLLTRSTDGPGAAHGSDHEVMLGLWRLIVSDTSTGSASVPRRHRCGPVARPTGARPPACCGPPRRTPATRPRSSTSRPPTSGPSTSGSRPGSTRTPRATLGLRGMAPARAVPPQRGAALRPNRMAA